MTTTDTATRDSLSSRPSLLPTALGASVGLLIHLGAFKGTSALSELPVDPTLLLAMFVAVLGVTTALKYRIPFLAATWPLLSLWIVFLLGMPFLASTAYAHQKVLLLFTLCAGIACVSCQMSERKDFLVGLLWAQVAAGGLMAILLRFFAFGADLDERLLLDGSNSIGAARVVGAAIVVLFVLSLGSRRRLLVHGLAILALTTILIGIGSRGPLLFAALASVAAAGVPGRSRLNKPLRPMFSLVLLGAMIYYLAGYESRRLPLARLMAPFTENISTDQSIGARLSLINSSISLIAQNPLGVGWGNFAQAARANGLPVYLRHTYPHNVALEVGVEAGVIALAVFALVTLVAVRGLHRSSTSASWAAAFALGLYALGNALVSGDLSSNRPMWCAIGLGMGCWVRRARTASPPTHGSGGMIGSAEPVTGSRRHGTHW